MTIEEQTEVRIKCLEIATLVATTEAKNAWNPPFRSDTVLELAQKYEKWVTGTS
jgi:hypothetical protein